MPENYDVVIVGAGMAGGILAARIAERGVNPRTGERLRIALMDMGPYFKGDPRPGYGIPLRRQAYANLPAADDIQPYGSTPWGTIAGIGGQSLHYAAHARLPSEEGHQHWVSETGVDWSYEKLTDARTEITEMFHIRPEPEELLPPGSMRFRDAVTKMGYQVYRFPGGRVNCLYCGACGSHACKWDAKSAPLVRYIPIAERNGVEIMPGTTVEKVILEKRGATAAATGVIFTQAGKTQEARAEKVILSCNNIGTPLLLFKSGYGPKELVQGELIAENPNVGRNMDEKIDVVVEGAFDEPVQRADLLAWGPAFYFFDRGPQGHLNIAVNDEFGGGAMPGGGSPVKRALHGSAPAFGREHKEYMKKLNHFGHVFCEVEQQNLVRGQMDSSGRGTLKFTHPEIVKRVREARELAREILLTMGAKWVSDITGPIEIEATGNVGSCRGGADRRNSVVNSDFECHDVENLFICDGSVFPNKPTACNGGTTTGFLACHAWRRIVAKHFSRA